MLIDNENTILFLKSGYTYITFTEETQELVSEAIQSTRYLFSLPNVVKEEFHADVNSASYSSGYSRFKNSVHEKWHLSSNDFGEKWPTILNDKLIIFKKLTAVFQSILIPFLDNIATICHINEKGNLARDLRSGTIRFRLLHYHPATGIGFDSHIDSGISTLFLNESNQGLQIWENSKWSFVKDFDKKCLLGCAHTLSSLSAIPPLKHRVCNSGDDRYAIAVFFHANDGKFSTLTQ